jgi:hypothetical protein
LKREQALSLVDDLKAELPIPPETCSQIDDVIDMVSKLVVPAEKAVVIVRMMEELRKDNSTLRELGREWYTLADDLAHQFPHEEE